MDLTGNDAGEKTTASPVTFSVSELWVLSDLIRHEMREQDTWKFPPASRELNEQISLALVDCVDLKLSEYTLLLSIGDLLVIDYWVRHDLKSPEGARGDAILLKTFRARQALSYSGYRIEVEDSVDVSYQDAMKLHAQQENKEDATTTDQPDDGPDADPNGDAGPVPSA